MYDLICLIKEKLKWTYAMASIVRPSNFPFKRLLLKNGCRDLLQTWHKCTLWGPDQVLLLLSGSEIQDGHPGLW